MKKKDWLKEQEGFSNEPLTSLDKELFEKVFESLDSKVGIFIPETFAFRVVQKQVQKESLIADIKLYAFYAFLFTFLLCVCILFFQFSDSDSGLNSARLILDNFGLILSGTFIYFVIQTLDRVLIKTKHQG
jgi:hypothetical protein